MKIDSGLTIKNKVIQKVVPINDNKLLLLAVLMYEAKKLTKIPATKVLSKPPKAQYINGALVAKNN